MADTSDFIKVLQDEGLQAPKFSAHVHQLLRLEQLVDVAFNNYANLNSGYGRDKFMSAVELIYVALTPFLKKDDRMHIQSWLIRIRNMVDDLNNPMGSVESGDLISLRKFAWQVLEIMNMLKTRRGLGVPTKERKILEEELAQSADIIPDNLIEGEEYKIPDVPDTGKAEKEKKG